MWRDGLWVLALGLAIITIGFCYQLWLSFNPHARAQRAQLKGDGVHVESYGFDLSKLGDQVKREEIVATKLHRDEIPVLIDPGHITVAENSRLTGYAKYVLPTDRVIGVVFHSVAVAYPIQVMQVHWVANDVVGGQPLLVAYDPLAECVSVWNSSLGDYSGKGRNSKSPAAVFRVSGLAMQGRQLLYTEEPAGQAGGNLWDPLRGWIINGAHASQELGEGPLELTPTVLQWRDWVKLHPDTLIVKRDEDLRESYKEDTYGPYYQDSELPYAVTPALPLEKLRGTGVGAKTRGIGIVYYGADYENKIFIPYETVIRSGTKTPDGTYAYGWAVEGFGDFTLLGRPADKGFTPATVWLTNDHKGFGGTGHYQETPECFLFAWFATHPYSVIDVPGKEPIALTDPPKGDLFESQIQSLNR